MIFKALVCQGAKKIWQAYVQRGGFQDDVTIILCVSFFMIILWCVAANLCLRIDGLTQMAVGSTEKIALLWLPRKRKAQ